jgi:hypothetical protein
MVFSVPPNTLITKQVAHNSKCSPMWPVKHSGLSLESKDQKEGRHNKIRCLFCRPTALRNKPLPSLSRSTGLTRALICRSAVRAGLFGRSMTDSTPPRTPKRAVKGSLHLTHPALTSTPVGGSSVQERARNRWQFLYTVTQIVGFEAWGLKLLLCSPAAK